MAAVDASTSTSTGVAPRAHTAAAVGTAVNAGTITSSPADTPTARSASCNPDAPLADAHRVPVSEQQRQLVLAGLELGAQQQVAGAEHPLDGIEEHGGLRSVASGQVDDGDHACSR